MPGHLDFSTGPVRGDFDRVLDSRVTIVHSLVVVVVVVVIVVAVAAATAAVVANVRAGDSSDLDGLNDKRMIGDCRYKDAIVRSHDERDRRRWQCVTVARACTRFGHCKIFHGRHAAGRATACVPEKTCSHSSTRPC